MAIQPPPAPTVAQQGVPPPAPRKGGCFGCGCGGCLLVVVVALLLVGGSGYYFFVVQAQAAIAAPAALVVINQPVDVNGNPGIAGEALNPNDTVHTGGGGHAAIQFPDGSYVRMSPDTQVTLTSAQLQKNGNLQSASVAQRIGRTFSSVEHLAGGASFQVAGHSVSAQVRGTQFEVLVRSDNTNLIKVFDGTVTVAGTTTVKLTAGQQIDADANGRLSNQRGIQPDPQDPYPLTTQCSRAAASGNNSGTLQSSGGESLTNGQTAESDYNSPGGDLTLAFCYPGSLMKVTVTDPAGGVHAKQGAPPLVIKIANGPPGVYKAVVTALNVAAAGEAYSLSFATYYSNLGGLPISWTIDFYAATPNLGAVITQVTVRGINVTTQVVSRLSSLGANSITSMPTGFIVDRVYSCNGPGGDDMMVIEGHRST